MNTHPSPQRRRERRVHAEEFSAQTLRSLRLCGEVLVIAWLLLFGELVSVVSLAGPSSVLDGAGFDRDRVMKAANQYLKERPMHGETHQSEWLNYVSVPDILMKFPPRAPCHQQFGKILITPRGSRDWDLGGYEVVPPYDHCASF